MSVEDTYRLLFLEISLKPTDLKKFILKVLSLEILQYRFLIFKSSPAYLIIFSEIIFHILSIYSEYLKLILKFQLAI